MLVIDHNFHTKTNSFDFLVEILVDRFEIKRVYISPEENIFSAQLPEDYEYVLILQMDWMASFFIMKEKKVIVVPMYDGSGSMPDSHWGMLRQARFLNFSMTLHSELLRNGCESLLLKYFPNPDRFPCVKDFASRRVFFWERAPNSSINVKTVARILPHFDKLHVHSVPDDPCVAPSPIDEVIPENSLKKVSVSKWFEQRTDYLSVLEGCNVFVSPRIAEGIGHSFLEAMARGMAVIAYDLPTHNEYIYNYFNGILFDGSSEAVGVTDIELEKIGKNARETVRLGYEKWKSSKKELLDFVLGAKPSLVPGGGKGEAEFLLNSVEKINLAYSRGISTYSVALEKYALPRLILGDWRDACSLVPAESITHSDRRGDQNINIVFGGGNEAEFLGKGWSASENGYRAAISESAELLLPIGRVEDVRELVIEARANVNRDINVLFDEKLIGKLSLTDEFAAHHIALSTPLGKSDVRIALQTPAFAETTRQGPKQDWQKADVEASDAVSNMGPINRFKRFIGIAKSDSRRFPLTFTLSPNNDLRGARENEGVWEVTGEDPQFALLLKGGFPLEAHKYYLRARGDRRILFLQDACLYLDVGCGFSEAERVDVRFCEEGPGVYVSVCKFEKPVQGLRFDPSAGLARPIFMLHELQLVPLGEENVPGISWTQSAGSTLGQRAAFEIKSLRFVNHACQGSR
ncbi:glycosyltransferase [Methylocystis iwaonis]|uniref:glycosyltransferase n=1 Tax=Methylocystis iwaonis TaxID=2885079 RepID=UPI002E7BC2E0|nr:glycosyltransferase [Methylocystis iwaonis]